MKKKKLLIPLALIALIMILIFSFAVVTANRGYGISQGRFLKAKNGQPMLILDNSPIEMSDRKEKNFFDSLHTGDEIFVIHDGIEESYPGKTGVYAVFKLNGGTIDDIPKDVLNSLVELGWLEPYETTAEIESTELNSAVATEMMKCVINQIDGNHFIVEELDNDKKSGITYQFTHNSDQFSVGDEITVEFRYPISSSIPYGLTEVNIYKSE